MKDRKIKNIAIAGLMAALCFVGYMFFPAFTVTGTKIHVGNAFVVLGALLLGGLYGGLAGAVGLTLADIVSGYAASAPRTFITKLVIGLIVGLVAHKIASVSHSHKKNYYLKWSLIASLAGLGVNCVFEPFLKWVWYTILTPDADKAQAAIKALMVWTKYTTFINALINTAVAVVLYVFLRPALKKAGLIGEIGTGSVKKESN